MPGVTKRLKISEEWVAAHGQSIDTLDVRMPTGTPSGKHATRQLHAHVETPGGGQQQFTEEVSYSLPPADGECQSAAKRRAMRHWKREHHAVGRLNGAYAQKMEAARQVLEEEEARLLRRDAVIRNGNTLYRHPSFHRVKSQATPPSPFPPACYMLPVARLHALSIICLSGARRPLAV